MSYTHLRSLAFTGAFAASVMMLLVATPAMATLGGATDDGSWLAAEGCARPAVVINSIKLTSTDLVSSATVANLRLGDYLCIENDGRSVAGQGAYEKIAHTKTGQQGVVDSSAIVEAPGIVLSAADFSRAITVYVEPKEASLGVVSALAKASHSIQAVPAGHPLIGDDPTILTLNDGQKLLVDDSVSVTAVDGMYGSAIWHPARTADGKTTGWVNEAILTATDPSSSASASPIPSESAAPSPSPSASASGESLWDKLKSKTSDAADRLSEATHSDGPSTIEKITSTPATIAGLILGLASAAAAVSSLGRRHGVLVKSSTAAASAIALVIAASIAAWSVLPVWALGVLAGLLALSCAAAWSAALRFRDARPSFTAFLQAIRRPMPLVALAVAALSSLLLLFLGVTAWPAFLTMSLLLVTVVATVISSGQTDHDDSSTPTSGQDTEPTPVPTPDPLPTLPIPTDEPITPEAAQPAESEATNE